MLSGSGSERLRRYKKIGFLGRGFFATVDEYEDVETGERVAIKKEEKKKGQLQGIDMGALKEIQAMNEIGSHVNVVTLVDAFPVHGQLHVILQRCVADLDTMLKDDNITFTEANIKCIARMMLSGLEHCHSRGFLHRVRCVVLNRGTFQLPPVCDQRTASDEPVFPQDLKPENLLFDAHGTLKLADFGHATMKPTERRGLYHRVVTLWYRAPELLMGARHYGPAVDMWSAGCILAEMLLRCPLFPGNPLEHDDKEAPAQLSQIFRLLGTPEESEWPGVTHLPEFIEFEPRRPQRMEDILGPSRASLVAIDLVASLLVLDPGRRLSATEALAHPFFHDLPRPTEPHLLPLPKAAQGIVRDLHAARRRARRKMDTEPPRKRPRFVVKEDQSQEMK